MELLPKMLTCRAAERPDARALVCGDEELNYGQLAGRVELAGAGLTERGVRPGESVAVPGDLSIAGVVAFLAVVRIGAVAVPLPTWVGADVREAIVRDCGARVIVGSNGIERGCSSLPRITIDKPDPIDIIYSSGTTGRPKGVVHPHEMRAFQIERMGRLGLGASSKVLVATPLCSNTTLVTLLPTIAHGGAAILMPRFDAEQFLRLAERERATHTMLVPVQYRRLLNHPRFEQFDLSAFRALFSTGAPLDPGLKRALLARWPGRLVEIYGLTEGGCTCVLDARAHPDKLESVGRPAEGVEIAFLDEDGREIPRGEVGEIAGRAVSMMAGYQGRPDLTEEVIWRDSRGRRFIKTGDLGRVDEDGFVHLCGRKKDVIISGGFNVYPEDLERALLDHAEVVEAAAVAAPSERWGETPVAFVVRARGASSSAEEIVAHANGRLGKVQHIDLVVFVDELPRNALGKVLRDELREQLGNKQIN